MKEIRKDLGEIFKAIDNGKPVYMEVIIRREITSSTTLRDLYAADRIVVDDEWTKEEEAEMSVPIPEEEINKAVVEAVEEEMKEEIPDPEENTYDPEHPEDETPSDFVKRMFSDGGASKKESKTQKFVNLWNDGYSPKEIANILGVTDRTVYNNLRKAGIDYNSK